MDGHRAVQHRRDCPLLRIQRFRDKGLRVVDAVTSIGLGAIERSVCVGEKGFVSKSTPTLQVVTNPMLNAGSPIHDGSFAALKALGADYVRYVPWLQYPKIAVAELEPPTKDHTSWDFTYIDPVTKDFSCRFRRAFDHRQFQYHLSLDVQDRQTRKVSRRS